MTFEKYQDRAGKYRWRLLADNHRILAVSSESYEKISSRNKALALVKNHGLYATVREVRK